jgi:hypothetical protein
LAGFKLEENIEIQDRPDAYNLMLQGGEVVFGKLEKLMSLGRPH